MTNFDKLKEMSIGKFAVLKRLNEEYKGDKYE